MFSMDADITVINYLTTVQGLRGRKRKIVLPRSSGRLFGLRTGQVWKKIDILPTHKEVILNSEFLLLCSVQEGLYVCAILSDVEPKPNQGGGEIWVSSTSL